MNSFEKNIINRLLNKYEASKISKGGTKNNREIKMTTKDKELSTYIAVDSYKYVEMNDEILKKLEGKGFINLKYTRDTFCSLSLNINSVDELYCYIGRKKPSEELNNIRKVLDNYSFDNFINEFIDYVRDYINKNYDYPKIYFNDYNQLELLLNVFENLFRLDENMRVRDFSAKYLGDSKLFDSIKNKIIKIIRDFDDVNDKSDDEILAIYNIIKNSTYVLVKNKLIIKINNTTIDLNDFGYELSLSDEMIKALSIQNSGVSKVVTVENLTSFYDLNEKDSVIIYLAGFHNHTKQEFLKKIFSFYPNALYYHFGDIDAGGFMIYQNLIEKTKIPFIPYKMGIDELKSNENRLKKLTENDKKRLKALLRDSRFKLFEKVINYMLEKNVKLEQEILS